MRYHDAYDAVSMAVYLLAIYVWGLYIYPMGRDFGALAGEGANLPFLARNIFQWEMAFFATWLPGYHLVNMALLYGCMLCIYHFTNITVRGLWWFGTLAACMFMANPVHAESVLNLSGVGDLVPCLLALLALTAYAWQVHDPRAWKLAIALVLFALASFPYPANGFLVLVILLYETLAMPARKRSVARLALFLVTGVLGILLQSGRLFSHGFSPATMFAPLYFLFYPLGYLPETVVAFQERPWLGWLAALSVGFILLLIHRKARRRVILFGILAMLAIRLYPGERPIDPVTLVGGGQLLLANALYVVALVALFFRIMDHPKWRISMVGITTTLVIVLFAMQFVSVRRWHEAGQRVRAFQVAARNAAQDGPGPIGVLPDYQTYSGAPMRLSSSIAHETLFSPMVPAVSILPLNAERPGRLFVEVPEWTSNGGQVVIEGKQGVSPLDALPVPGVVARVGESAPVGNLLGDRTVEAAGAVVRVEEVAPGVLVLQVRAEGGDLPVRLVPGPTEPQPRVSAGEKTGHQPQANAGGKQENPTHGRYQKDVPAAD